MEPLQISGYYVLPITQPVLPSLPIPATHYLYLRPHEPKIPEPSASRSLFLVNVPFDATEAHLKHLFSTQLELPSGRVEEVQFEGHVKKTNRGQKDFQVSGEPQAGGKKNKRKRENESISLEELRNSIPSTWDRELHKAGSTAVVIFVDRESAEAVLKAIKRIRKSQAKIIWGEGMKEEVPSLGLARYLNHYRLSYPDRSELMDSVNTYMTAFAAEEAARSRRLARQRQEPDEDGFITVTRGGRTGPARQEQAQEAAAKQKAKQKGLDDFYRFQTREKRKERAGELIKKFEEDKEKIRKMREKRGKFRPE